MKAAGSKKDLYEKLVHVFLIVIPIVHVTLIFSNIYIIPLKVVYDIDSIKLCLSSMLVIIPTVVSAVCAAKVSRAWMYFFVAAACTGLCCLHSYVLGIISLGLFFIRFVVRLEKSVSVLNSPHYVGLIVFLIPFLCSGVYDYKVIQAYAVYSAFVYLLITVFFRQLRKTESYIKLNQAMANFPSKRLRKNMVVVNFLMVFIIAVVGGVGVFSGYSFKSIKLDDPETQVKYSMPAQETMVYDDNQQDEAFSMEEIAPEYTGFIDWNLLGIIATIITAVLLVLLFIYGLYRISSMFRRTDLNEENDIIENIDEDTADSLGSEDSFVRNLRHSFDYSQRVRKRYRKAVRQRKYTPEPWQTPEEIESASALNDIDLHRLYEKVRYDRTDA